MMGVGPGHLEKKAMQCMEIRGGNLAVEEALDAPGLQEWVCSRPYKSAASGGDVHYLSICASGTICRLILADVSGHGDAVSGFAVELRSLMEKNITVADQTHLVERLTDRALLGAIVAHRDGREADDDMTIVSWLHNGDGPAHSLTKEKIDA
jgi:hypothetical protein